MLVCRIHSYTICESIDTEGYELNVLKGGFETIKNCKSIGLKGIILKSEKNIVLDKTKIINFSNKNKMILDII